MESKRIEFRRANRAASEPGQDSGGVVFGSAEINGSIAVVGAATIDQASTGLRTALAAGPEVRVIRFLLDPKSEEFESWLKSARAAFPETRGFMVQRLFARIFSGAGFEVVVGSRLDIFARGRLRSLLVEVKSSLEGRKLGSHSEMIQLDGYLTASQRRGAERWLGMMGINKPMKLKSTFKAAMRARNIGLIDMRWVSPNDTLLSHF
jgi:hypothetical protein